MRVVADCVLREKIFESAVSSVYKAFWLRENKPVILKMLRKERPSSHEIFGLKYEYEIIRSLSDSPGVIRTYGLERFEDGLVMILEDIFGESLDRITEADSLNLEQRLKISIRLVDCLNQVHSLGVAHLNLNPSNVIMNSVSGLVKIIDFGLASKAVFDGGGSRNFSVMGGRLPYISPEQTGRLNLCVDYRSDYYSLGVTLYELFTGKLPFDSADPLELVHCHIAVKPIPPSEINPAISGGLSGIILKLLEKNPDNRYQSAYGIITDLKLCLSMLLKRGVIENFKIGSKDKPERLIFSSRIYGRGDETGKILDAFDRIRSGSKELVAVSGKAGIGKTSLVSGVKEIISSRSGYFVSGKFDQLHRDILNNAVLSPFREIVSQLLSESEESLAEWRVQFLEALGPNCQIIIDIIPELEMVVGPQAPVPKLEPIESENRFKLEFQNFLSVFCRSEHPITIFLDDVQWADLFSLKLLEFMLADPDTKFLLVIVSYRDEEVDSSHPFITTSGILEKHEITISSIDLGPLDSKQTTELVIDALRTHGGGVEQLGELIHRKTQGNPFFMKEFLKSIYDEKLIHFDYSLGVWTWDSAGIIGRDVSTNVVALLEERIGKLPDSCRNMIKVASCMGNRFDLQTLSWFFNQSAILVAKQLATAIDEGLIYPVDDNHRLIELGLIEGIDEASVQYKFAHDRIQQTSYSLIADHEKSEFHKRLGTVISEKTPLEFQEVRLFEIVTHLNLAASEADPAAYRHYLAKLNLRVGKKAKESTANQIALSNFCKGMELLGDDGWVNDYELMLELCTQATVSAFLITDFDEMNRHAADVTKHGRNLIDKVKVFEILIQADIARNQRYQAVRTALPVLRLLGQKFPDKPNKAHVIIDLIKTKFALFNRNSESLLQQGQMTNEEKLATMRILRSVISAAYTVAPELFALMICRMVRLSVRHGIAPQSALAYAAYAMVLIASLEDIDSGLKFGELALQVCKMEICREDQTRVTFVYYAFIKTRNALTRDGLEPLLDNYRLGREMGDFEYASLSAAFYCTHSYGAGRDLVELEREVSGLARSIGRMKQETTQMLANVYHQEILNMMEPSGDPCLLIGKVCDESLMVSQLSQTKENSVLCAIHVQKLRLCYSFRDYKVALESSVKAEHYLAGAKGSMLVPIVLFYGSLARVAVAEGLEGTDRFQMLRQVSKDQKQLKKWAIKAPMNFMHKFFLVEAERFRISNQFSRAMDYFDLSIKMAGENQYINEEALAYERAGMFLFSVNNEVRGKFYLEQALDCYLKWGATAKVKDLRDKYPDYLKSPSAPIHASPGEFIDSAEDLNIDLTGVIRASQNISAEIVFEKLLKKLMKIVIQVGGAERGLLLMDDEGSWVVKATAFSQQDDESLHGGLFNVGDCDFSPAIINYVSRTKKPLILNDARADSRFANDRHIKLRHPKSVCCIPVIRGGELTGILYMENNQAKGVFTTSRVEMLEVLATQAATSIQNATLYKNLDETAKKYESLFQNAQEAIFITDGRKIKFCNPKTFELTGYSSVELYNRELTELIFQDDLEIFLNQQDKSRRSASESNICSFRLIRKDQTILWAQNNCVLIEWDGDPAILNFLTDITEVKLAADLHVRTERLKAIGELASGVAHNFNNLLQILLGEVELALINLESGRLVNTTKSLDQIRKSITLGSETVKRLQSFAGIRSSGSSSSRKIFDLSQSLIQAFEITRPLWKTNLERNDIYVDAKFDVAPNCYVEGNESEIFEVLVNLIKNAVEAMPEGGIIRGSTSINNKEVVLKIHDSGKGISEYDMTRMFEPFWSTKGSSGTGLGLAISQKIISDHSGSISVRSQLGRGTEFTICMPLASEVPEESIIAVGQGSQKSLRILVIDDSRPIVTLLEDLLTAFGHDVLGACSGDEGIAVFVENEVDMVICDLGMPDTNGWEVGRRIVSICQEKGISKTPFVLLTGWGGQSLESVRLSESGVDGVMEKPIDAKGLARLIQKMFEDVEGA